MLAGTAEIPLAGTFVNQILPRESLPRRIVGFGHCFRREAGSRGVGTRGLYRLHQFSKVEMFCVTEGATAPQDSENMLEELLELQIEMFSELGLHFRSVKCLHSLPL